MLSLSWAFGSPCCILGGSFRVYLFTSFTGDLVLPIFGLFIPLLASELGANAVEIGFVGGASYVSYSFVPFVAGRYSDKRKLRQSLMLAALIVLAVVSSLYFFVVTPVQLIAIRIVEGVGWSMLWPIIQAAIADDVRMEPSKSLNLYNVVWSAAAAVGPLVGVVLILVFQSIRTIFLLSVLLLLAAVFANLIPILRDRGGRLEEKPVPSGPAHEGAGVVTPRRIHVTNGSLRGHDDTPSHGVWFFVVALIFVMGVRGIIFTFALPLAESTGVPVLLIGSFAVFFGVSRFATYLFTTRDDLRGWVLARRRIGWNVMGTILLCSIGGLLPIIPDKTGLAFLASFVLCGVAASGIGMISQVQMIALNPYKRGENAGLLESSIGVGAGFGPIVAGAVAGGSLLIPFYLPASGVLLVMPALYFLSTRRSRSRAAMREP